MRKRFESKVILISGATSGIGEATAKRFAEEGGLVVCVGRNSNRGDALVDHLKSRQIGEAFFVQADVKNPPDVELAVRSTIEKFGRIDVLFNNAGVELISSCVDMTEEQWDDVINTNLKSVFLFSKHCLPWLKRSQGAIINNGSELGLIGAPNYTAYCASKGGILLFTKALALECAESKVRVNCVCPGATETRMLERELAQYPNKEAVRTSVIENIPLRRIASPDEIAGIVVFLASDEANYVTGAIWSVDGGTTTK
jgi:NAD(P)-dependent dehydrogenase (short-subunit alcohol dehydrogenase family)